MENNTTKSRGSLKALFLIPSIIGVILFMIPVKNADGDWTVVVKIIADIISGAIGGFLPLLCVIILTVSAVMCLRHRRLPAPAVRHHPDGLRRHVPCCVGKAQVYHG